MILAIYSKFKSTDKWLLHAFAPSMEQAKKFSAKVKTRAKSMGYDEAEVVIQGFDSATNVPKTLETVKPEKQCYN